MNKNGFANIVLIILVIVLAGALGYFTLIKKSTPSPIPPVSPEKHTISLETIPITFELPKGYAVFQQEGHEGGYATTISVGKEVSSGYLKYAPFQMEFSFYIYDAQLDRTYQPSEYIDVVFEEQKKDIATNPKYIQLFGNKAVQYTGVADGSTAIIGYLKADQLPNLSKEYLVQITSSTYGTGVGFDKELFDTIINSLRIIK